MVRLKSSGRTTRPLLAAVDYRNCLAKTWRNPHTKRLQPGRTVFDHCRIVGEVARQLIATFPPAIKEKLFADPAACALLAACHDIGKVSPLFYLRLQVALNCLSAQDRALLHQLGFASESAGADQPRHFLPPVQQQALRARLKTQDSSRGGHATISAVALKSLTGQAPLSLVAGIHHGYWTAPAHQANDEVYGGPAWQAERLRLVRALQEAFNCPWPVCTDKQWQWLAGLTTVADWIGSGPWFDDPDVPWQPHISEALNKAGMVQPKVRAGLAFGDIFKDEKRQPFTPNEAQQALAAAVTRPGIYVLEAPMGMGKTEAALWAAYRMLTSGQARGIYFALPTQLTSDKIHTRFQSYLDAILAPDSPQRDALLLHGRAWLQQQVLGVEGKPGGAWFSTAKRSLLAPFAVGTLDQALMAAMRVKHSAVRAFGLAGKVVILDEIHSYDAYTHVILDAMLSLLSEMQCTVIILSATLTHQLRYALLAEPQTPVQHADNDAYPLITARPNDKTPRLTLQPLTAPSAQTVRLRFSAMDGEAAQQEALRRAAQGEQVLWIENTVAEAQARYAGLAARAQELDASLECGLLHSRFTPQDRARLEEKWVDAYGKKGLPDRQRCGRILVGTQVLEQSLDIDADFMISRFAPTDLLLQRLGRLWRHAGTPRVASARCEAWILAPQLLEAQRDPYQVFGTSAFVYAPYVLCRSLEVWLSRDVITLPDDIRAVLEATWQERAERERMADWKHELLHGRKRAPQRAGLETLRQQARLTLLSNDVTLPESRAQTRYSEQDSRSLVLFRQLNVDAQQRVTHLHLLDGQMLTIPWSRTAQSEAQWRQMALQLENNRVPLSAHQAPPSVDRQWARQHGFGHLVWLGEDAERSTGEPEACPLLMAQIEACGDLRFDDLPGVTVTAKFRYQYLPHQGLVIQKQED